MVPDGFRTRNSYLLLARVIYGIRFLIASERQFQVKRQGGARGVSRRSAPDRDKPAEQPVEAIRLQDRRGAHYRHEWCLLAL